MDVLVEIKLVNKARLFFSVWASEGFVLGNGSVNVDKLS